MLIVRSQVLPLVLWEVLFSSTGSHAREARTRAQPQGLNTNIESSVTWQRLLAAKSGVTC